MTALAQGKQSVSVLVSAAEAAGGQVVYRPSFPKPRPDPTSLPPPTPPAHSPFGSLTAYLRHTPEARQAIRVALNQPLPHPPDAPLVCPPPRGANPGLIGTAFDHALRFVMQGLHPHPLLTPGPVRGFADEPGPGASRRGRGRTDAEGGRGRPGL